MARYSTMTLTPSTLVQVYRAIGGGEGHPEGPPMSAEEAEAYIAQQAEDDWLRGRVSDTGFAYGHSQGSED